MNIDSAATRKDIDDVLNVLDVMMTRIDERFTKSEDSVGELQKHLRNIEISEDERLVMAIS